MDIHYPLKIKPQPTESTCGPTCLQAVYNFHNHQIGLEKIISEINELESGGVLGVQLGVHALEQGFSSTIYTHNIRVFDPTWFKLSQADVLKKLELQIAGPKSPRIRSASGLYHEFISKGGKVLLETLTPEFLLDLIKTKGPIITGLSATYLYRSPREHGPMCDYDDILGEPQGHFVIIAGISEDGQVAWISDPHEHNPAYEGQHYSVSTIELINSILIGVLTYDANLIIIQPPKKRITS